MSGREKLHMPGFLSTFQEPPKTSDAPGVEGPASATAQDFPIVKAVEDPSSRFGVSLFLKEDDLELVPLEDVPTADVPREVVVDASGGVRFLGLVEALGAAGVRWAGLPVGENGDVLNGIEIPEREVLQRLHPRWAVDDKIATPAVSRGYKRRHSIERVNKALVETLSAMRGLPDQIRKLEGVIADAPSDDENDNEDSMVWAVAHEALAAAAVEAERLNETLARALRELEGVGRGAVR